MSYDPADRHRLSLEEVLDLCLDDLAMERATVDECLERYPAHREALEPVLRTAIAFNGIPVEEVPQPNPEQRAAFMSALRETPQARPRFRLPALSLRGRNTGRLWRGALVGIPATAIALLAIIFATTTNPSTASAATLTVFAGNVERQDGDAWVPIEDGAPVTEGTTLRTGSRSRALITFPDGSTATFDAATEITLRRIVVEDTRQIEIAQSSGRVWNDVRPIGKGDSYTVHTPHAVVSAHGTVFETFVDGVTAVRADSGLVQLTSRGESVEIRPGQQVTATVERIEAPVQAMVTGSISVNAPAVAYLSSSDGAATGAFASGVVFRQVPGVATSEGETNGRSQQFTLGDVAPGHYSLVIERVSDGDGDVVIETPAGRIVLPVPASSVLSRVEVEVEERDGVRTLRTSNSEARTVEREDTPGVRIADAARTRTGIDIAALAAAHRTATATATAEPSPTGSPTPESGALVTPAPPATPAPRRPDDASDRGPGFFPGRRDDDRPEATRTPETPPSVSREEADDAEPGGWITSLRRALRSDDEAALTALFDEALTGDPAIDQERLAAILAVVEDPNVRGRIARLLADEIDPDTAERLREAIENLQPGAGALLGGPGPALPVPALPIRPSDRRSSDDDSDDRDRRPGRGDLPFPFSDFRFAPDPTRAPSG